MLTSSYLWGLPRPHTPAPFGFRVGVAARPRRYRLRNDAAAPVAFSLSAAPSYLRQARAAGRACPLRRARPAPPRSLLQAFRRIGLAPVPSGALVRRRSHSLRSRRLMGRSRRAPCLLILVRITPCRQGVFKYIFPLSSGPRYSEPRKPRP